MKNEILNEDMVGNMVALYHIKINVDINVCTASDNRWQTGI